MKIKTTLLLGILIGISVSSFAQNPPVPRELPALRITDSIKVDGILNEPIWASAPRLINLIELRPKPGAPEEQATRSETYLVYNNEGVYFAGFLYERTKDSISSELRGRDGFGNNDFIGIIFDTYKDRQNGFEYFVTPGNEQMDAKQSPSGGEDFSWNAVWESATVIHENGWAFEMFIPYSAIRFGNSKVQDWGLNITRRRQKTGQQYFWNPIDPNVNGFLTQEGYWKGISNIKAPLRLQFSPYFSTYVNHEPVNKPGVKNWTSQVNGGMDVKYGISPAFTLDATLIPDFGQVQSDNRILNLTAFDVQFNENRSFFTEGTELFSKGGLFYSRKIGVEPEYPLSGWAYAQPGIDTVIKDPQESKLINATKISGRTQKGLGIGVLNAITQTRYATLENKFTKESRKVVTDPITNYNVFVLDQTLKNNSSISLVNTNVWRSGRAYDANVTAGLFSFNDKKNKWNFSGQAAVSNQFGYPQEGKTLTGYSQSLSFGKTSGRMTFSVFQDITDTKYTHRDLGFFTNNNFLIHGGRVNYQFTEPKGWYNRIFLNVNGSYNRLLTKINPVEQVYQNAYLNFNFEAQSKKLWWAGAYLGLSFRENDFYEPRNYGRFFRRGASLGYGLWFESNSTKKYSFYSELFARSMFNFYKGFAIDYTLSQTYRFNTKFSLSYRFSVMPRFNNIGYAYDGAFSRRKRMTAENIFSTRYNFTNKMGLTFRARYYMATVRNLEFFALQTDGKLIPDPTFSDNVDLNLNFFNIDMVYTWQFAPGSFVNIVWKSFVENNRDVYESSIFKNFRNTLETDQINNLSVKVIYFLDYLEMKKKRAKRKSA